MTKRVELLAPAGDLERAKIALLYGADAVYVGGEQFSLRARASNFSLNDLAEIVQFAHERGKLVYVTMNIIPHHADFCQVDEYLQYLEKIKVDAIIVSSLTIMAKAAVLAPHLELHLSTQTSAANHLAVQFYQSQGAKRVVLARELALDEIALIAKQTDCELEVFIHGGMCAGFSGRCVLSNHMSDRDANRGGCAHSCRWNYTVQGENLPPFNLASKDLMAIEQIPALLDMGIASLKIEGRMKSAYYLACVVRSYRYLIDCYYQNGQITNADLLYAQQEISKAENRSTCSGFLPGLPNEHCQLYADAAEIPSKDYLGIVIDYDNDHHLVRLEQRNCFMKGMKVEFFGPNLANQTFVIEEIIDPQTDLLVDTVRQPLKQVDIRVPFVLHKNDMMRRLS